MRYKQQQTSTMLTTLYHHYTRHLQSRRYHCSVSVDRAAWQPAAGQWPTVYHAGVINARRRARRIRGVAPSTGIHKAIYFRAVFTRPQNFACRVHAGADRSGISSGGTLAPNMQVPAGTWHDLSQMGLLPTGVYIDSLICDHRDNCAVTKATLLTPSVVSSRSWKS